MFRRRTKIRPTSIILPGTSKGSDILGPNNTSLVVNESNSADDIVGDIPRDLEPLSLGSGRSSSGLMASMSQKKQSTPKNSLKKSTPVKKALSDLSNIQLSEESGSSADEYTSLNERGKQSLNFENQKPGNVSKQKELPYYLEVLRSCGAKALSGKGSYLLAEDQAVLSSKLNSFLKEKNTAKQFLESLEEYVSNTERLKKLLSHTETDENCDAARGPVQEPMVRILLNVEVLQDDLLKFLMEKLANFVIDCDPETDDYTLVNSILRQIRSLNRPKDSLLAEKLFEIVEAAPTNIQREIISVLPEVILQEENEEVATKLLTMLKFNSQLTQVIIDTLNNLALSAHLRSRVRGKILSRLDKCPSEFLPLLVQFVISRCESANLLQVISSLREELPFTMQHHEIREAQRNNSANSKSKAFDDDTYIKLTFDNLNFSILTCKQTLETWMKIITNTRSSKEFRCVDLIILIMIFNNVPDKKNQVASLIRSKIKANILVEHHVKEMFKILLVVATEYFSAIMKLSSVLCSSIDSIVSDFSVLLYETSFVNFNLYLRQDVMSDILSHIGAGNPHSVNIALNVLENLCKGHETLLCEHTVSIMGTLIRLPEFEPGQVRQLVDIIAQLIFSNSSEDLGLQDELQMFIRKQLCSPKIDANKKGVVGAIMYVKHAVGVDRSLDETKLAEVNSLLNMAQGSSKSSDCRRSFFNDELATVLRESPLSSDFIEIWSKCSFEKAMGYLFAKNLEMDNEYFPMTLQYALDSEEQFVFPVLKFVLQTHAEEPLDVPLAVIPSVLRLLWCSHEKPDRIFCLLSASVIMPEPSVYEKFLTLDVTQQKIIVDCLFLCSNFFTECINAFCTQKACKEKVLTRIKQLIEVRKLITRFWKEVPDYNPPFCQFYSPPQKIVLRKRTSSDGKRQRKGKKRKSDGSVAESPSQSTMDMSELPCTSRSISVEIVGLQKSTTVDVDPQVLRGYFRELHCHTYKLLRMELKLNPSKVFKKTKLSDVLVEDMSWTYRPTEKPEMSPPDLLFLLEDFICKSEKLLKHKRPLQFNLKIKPAGSVIEHISSKVFLEGSISILPKLCIKMDLLAGYCKDLLNENDDIYGAPGMFPKAAADIKLCLSDCLKIVSDVVSWHGLRSLNNRSQLRDVLSKLSRRQKHSSTATAMFTDAIDAGNYLASFESSILLLSGGISIVKGTQACFSFGGNLTESQNNVVATLCYEFICRPWFTVTGALERGTVYNHHIDYLLKVYFSTVDDQLNVVRKIAEITVDEVGSLTTKDSAMSTFKTIRKNNFPLLYRSLCDALVKAATNELSKELDHEAIIEIWTKVVHNMVFLVEIVKILSTRENLAALLKRSQSILSLFLSKGIRVMETALRVKSTDVLKVLKTLQAVTRYLHSICCHSNLNNVAVVAAHVPTIRAQCERLTLEVKGILLLNKIPMDCLTIAVLKNRDLQGNDILSQDTTEDESESDSELPNEEANSLHEVVDSPGSGNTGVEEQSEMY